MRNAFRNLISVLVLFATWMEAGSISRAQSAYQFTRVADTQKFAGLAGSPSLNAQGRVAFRASYRANPGGALIGPDIFAGDGSEQSLTDYTRIAATGPAFSINNDPGSFVGSRVAFLASIPAQQGSKGIFSSDGITRQTIVIDRTINLRDPLGPLMNRSGQVVYHGGEAGSDTNGLFGAQNGASSPIYRSHAGAIVPRGTFVLCSR